MDGRWWGPISVQGHRPPDFSAPRAKEPVTHGPLLPRGDIRVASIAEREIALMLSTSLGQWLASPRGPSPRGGRTPSLQLGTPGALHHPRLESRVGPSGVEQSSHRVQHEQSVGRCPRRSDLIPHNRCRSTSYLPRAFYPGGGAEGGGGFPTAPSPEDAGGSPLGGAGTPWMVPCGPTAGGAEANRDAAFREARSISLARAR